MKISNFFVLMLALMLSFFTTTGAVNFTPVSSSEPPTISANYGSVTACKAIKGVTTTETVVKAVRQAKTKNYERRFDAAHKALIRYQKFQSNAHTSIDCESSQKLNSLFIQELECLLRT